MGLSKPFTQVEGHVIYLHVPAHLTCLLAHYQALPIWYSEKAAPCWNTHVEVHATQIHCLIKFSSFL